ncbi:hypothetical protein ACIBF5_31690 [Micromonospora sp. NPDC050417]
MRRLHASTAWPTGIDRESVRVMADLVVTDELTKKKVAISELLP